RPGVWPGKSFPTKCLTSAMSGAKSATASMRVNGAWLTGDDGVIRPIIPGAVCLANRERLEVSFLLDAGADRTVSSSDFFSFLQPLEVIGASTILLAGIGGGAESITIDTAIAFVRDDGRVVAIRGTFGVFT